MRPETAGSKFRCESTWERELQARRIHASRETLSADSNWLSTTNTVFDGTYRHIHRAAKARDREREPEKSPAR